MRKRIYLSTVLLSATAIAGPALAQDSAKDWTGPYVGGALGYSTTDGGGDEEIVDDTGSSAAVTCNGRAAGATPSTGCGDDEDGTAWSGHVGYDRQMGNFVVGGVLEAGKTDVTDYVSGYDATDSYTLGRDIDWNADARLRAGVALGNTLLYGTGGVAYARVDNSVATTSPLAFTPNGDAKEDMWGYTVGGGVDQKVADNFSIGLLYKYTNYGESDFEASNALGTIKRDEDFDTHTVQVTTSYRF